MYIQQQTEEDLDKNVSCGKSIEFAFHYFKRIPLSGTLFGLGTRHSDNENGGGVFLNLLQV